MNQKLLALLGSFGCPLGITSGWIRTQIYEGHYT
jgi:hypothetical protein